MSYKSGTFEFVGAKYGLNTNDPAFALLPGEASELLNFKVLKGGALETMPPVVAYSNSAITGSVVAFEKLPISGTARDVLVGLNGGAYSVYYLDGNLDPQSISGALSGAPQLKSFSGNAVIMDGSYLKYLDGLTSVKMAYDDGTGTSGYQTYNLDDTSDASLALGNGTITRVAQRFTSQAWDDNYTIPPTRFTVILTRNGTGGSGSITMRLRAVSDDSILASKTFLSDVTTLTTTETQYYAEFTSSDITTEMSHSTAYYISLEYSGGDASNYVVIHCNNCGTGGFAYTYTGSYAADTAKNLLAGLRPGRPPKALFGVVANGRLWLCDPDERGRAKFSYANSIFDWSTSGYAGYVGAIDDNANNYEIGAIAELYGDLYFYGTEDQPFLCKLSGTTPTDFALSSLSQPVWATQNTVQTGGNDVWFSSGIGVNAISGVQEYGDLRANPYSAAVDNKFPLYWNPDTAITGYYDGDYWLYMPSYHRILVFHTKTPTTDPSGIGVRYPVSEVARVRDIFTTDDYSWHANGDEYYLQAAGGGDPGVSEPDFITMNAKKLTEGTAGSLTQYQWDYALDPTATYYTIYFKDSNGSPSTTDITLKSILAPQCFSSSGSDLFIGGSDGVVYRVDKTEYRDLSQFHPDYDWRPRYAATSGTYVTLQQQQMLAAGHEGGRFDFSIYKNDSQLTAFKTTQLALSIDDRLTIEELTGDVEDAYYLVDPSGSKNWKDIRVTGFSFQPRVNNLTPSGKSLIIRGCMFSYVQAE